ncbi:MAG: acetate--CoA ligase family protein [Sutterellaceae bacterium]|nr:acetate--CoA ligase family protein [Sutterellaceae bacterium]MDY2867579.1 acetate--CoA ligase family protein [Mesosutterella sp.]
MDLSTVMTPSSIALVGASTRDHTIGHDLLHKLVDYGYKGKLFLVNPKGGTIEGRSVYKSVAELPDGIDLAIIVINAKFVLDTVDLCKEKGIKGLVVISAGFKETGAAGRELEEALAEKVRKYGMTLVGPNCLGVVNTNPDVSMDGCFAESLPRRGDIGFVSQSGALGGGILNILKDLGIGFAQFISIGNQAHVNAASAISYWEDVPDVKQILLYMESILDPAEFRRLATRVSKKKPILALKAGRSAAGASAASSHTGSLAGADKAADALLRQSGVIREKSLKDLFSSAKAFSLCPLPKGDRIAIITNSGGPAIMATDAVEDFGMKMAKLSDETKEKLRSFLPPAASVKNPVDMIASAPLEHYRKTLETVLADDGVDMVLTIYLPFLGLKDTDVADTIMDIRAAHPEKPIVGVFMTKQEFFSSLSDKRVTVPFYMYSEEGVAALDRLNRQRIWVNRPEGKVPAFEVARDRADAVFKAAAADGRETLTTSESISVLDAYGIRTCRSDLARTEDEAVAIADRIGYPVVMKMTSKTISHKTDVGGVRVGIASAEQLRREYRDLLSKLTERGLEKGLEGVLIQEMVKGSREMVCGLATDPQYGPMIMFGLGGVFVEVLKDVAFRVAPLTDQDAREMVRSIRAWKLLEGVRGMTPAHTDRIEETLLRLSQLVKDFPAVSELDINPLIVSDKDGEPIAVDARIKMKR